MNGVKNLRICTKGHKYYKGSDCPVCPVCAEQEKPDSGFLSLLSAPARRALQAVDITTLSELAGYSEAEILKLHGIGPGSIPRLQNALRAEGLSFRTS